MSLKSDRKGRGKRDVHVDLGHTPDKELQLPLVEDGDELLWNELVEADHERVELLFDAARYSVLNDRIDVLSLVGFCDGDVRAVGSQFDGDHFSKTVDRRGERLVEYISDVVLPIIESETKGSIHNLKKSLTASISSPYGVRHPRSPNQRE